MKDFPFFTTENGIASLTLKEIPYTKAAYIKFQDASDPEKLLEECLEFCKMAGAEKIYGANHPIFESYPFHTKILRMSKLRDECADTDAALFPVTEQTLEQWRDIYNSGLKNVPNYSYLSHQDAKTLLHKGGGYFVHRDKTLLGIGIASGDRIDAVISVIPGAGEQVVLALSHALCGEMIELEVASTNERAMHLYKRMGFIENCQISCWYSLL